MIKFEVKIWNHWGKVKVKFGTVLDHFSSTRLMLAIKVKGLHD
jgi:hypothetical protein